MPGDAFCTRCGHRVGAPHPMLERRRQLHALARSANAEFAVVPQVLGFYLALLVPTLVVARAVGDRLVSAVFADGLLVVLALAWALGTRRLAPLGLRPPPGLAYLAALMAVPVTVGASVVLVLLPAHALGLPLVRYTEPFESLPAAPLWAILSTAILPGVFEELTFRGIMQPRLGLLLGRREAILATAVMFAILHLSIASLPFLVLMGVFLGLLRERSGSLYPGMLAHFGHNLVVVVAEYVLPPQ